MTKTELMTAMQAHRLVAVIRSRTAEEALATARAVGEAGVQFVEVTFTVPGAAEVIRTLSGEGQVHVGAGTVLSEEQARTGHRRGRAVHRVAEPGAGPGAHVPRGRGGVHTRRGRPPPKSSRHCAPAPTW